MNHSFAIGAFETAFGLLLAWHCPRAAVREYRTGIALGRHGDYPRSRNPIRFWAVIALTFLAGAMGTGFVPVGIATAIRG